MDNNKRPESMQRITTPELARAGKKKRIDNRPMQVYNDDVKANTLA